MSELFDLGMSHLADRDLFSLNRREFNKHIDINKKNTTVAASSLMKALEELQAKSRDALSAIAYKYGR